MDAACDGLHRPRNLHFILRYASSPIPSHPILSQTPHKNSPSPSTALAHQRTLPPPRPKILDITGFREPPFTLFALVSFTGAMGLYIPFFYITAYTTSTVPSTASELSWYMLPILSAGSIVGRTLPAVLADRVGSLPVLAVTTGVSAVLAFCWVAVGGSLAGMFCSIPSPLTLVYAD